jgi:hypothetical protein
VDGPRHEFFPRASNQQNVGVVPRYLAREVKYFQHRRAFPHDAVELQILQQLLFELADAPPLIVQRGHI